ncbi:MAG: acyloxyacyl hydrolase [Bacteroidota bacterium]
MIRNAIAILFLLVVCSTKSVNGQTSIATTAHKGYLLAHRPMVEGLRQDRVRGFDLSISRRTDGSKDWHHQYNFPEAGLYIGVWNLGNREELGTGISLIPYVDFPLARHRNSAWVIKFGWGVGFIEKKFDAEDNYKNVAVGSRINNAILLHPRYQFNISKSLALATGISLTHYSNGSFESPNLGVNMAALTLSLSLKLGADTLSMHKDTIMEKGRQWQLFASAFAKEVAPADGDKYVVGTLMGEHMWRRTNKFSFGVGADVFFDKSFSGKDGFKESNGLLGYIRTGVHASTEMHVGRTALVLAMGSYVYSGVIGETFYHRFGIRQQIGERYLLCMHVKSHWGKADFMEFGVARIWKNKKQNDQIHMKGQS